MIAILPPGPGGFLIALGIGICFWLLWEFVVRRRRTARTWLVDGLVAAGIFGVIALLPLPVHGWIARLGLGFIVFTSLFLILALGIRSYALRKVRRAWASGEDSRAAERIVVPEALESARDDFASLGFEQLTAVRLAGGSALIVLHRSSDSITGEVVSFPPPSEEAPILELTSIIGGRLGALTTSNFGLSQQLWHGELRQVFPGASVRQLLESHLEGRAFLRQRGIEPDDVTADELLDLREEMLQRSRAAVAAAPGKALRAEATRISYGRPLPIGRLADQPGITAKIDAFFGLRSRSPSDGTTFPISAVGGTERPRQISTKRTPEEHEEPDAVS